MPHSGPMGSLAKVLLGRKDEGKCARVDSVDLAKRRLATSKQHEAERDQVVQLQPNAPTLLQTDSTELDSNPLAQRLLADSLNLARVRLHQQHAASPAADAHDGTAATATTDDEERSRKERRSRSSWTGDADTEDLGGGGKARGRRRRASDGEVLQRPHRRKSSTDNGNAFKRLFRKLTAPLTAPDVRAHARSSRSASHSSSAMAAQLLGTHRAASAMPEACRPRSGETMVDSDTSAPGPTRHSVPSAKDQRKRQSAPGELLFAPGEEACTPSPLFSRPAPATPPPASSTPAKEKDSSNKGRTWLSRLSYGLSLATSGGKPQAEAKLPAVANKSPSFHAAPPRRSADEAALQAKAGNGGTFARHSAIPSTGGAAVGEGLEAGGAADAVLSGGGCRLAAMAAAAAGTPTPRAGSKAPTIEGR